MLSVIDLASHGFYYPFHLDADRSGYIIMFNPSPNPQYSGFTLERIADADRVKYQAMIHPLKENTPILRAATTFDNAGCIVSL